MQDSADDTVVTKTVSALRRLCISPRPGATGRHHQRWWGPDASTLPAREVTRVLAHARMRRPNEKEILVLQAVGSGSDGAADLRTELNEVARTAPDACSVRPR